MVSSWLRSWTDAELDGLGDGEVAQPDVLGQTHCHGIMDVRGRLGLKGGQAACDHGGIERIGLCNLPLGARETAHAGRIEQIGGHAKPVRQDRQVALIAARGFEADLEPVFGGEPLQPLAECREARLAVWNTPARGGGVQVDDEFVFGDIDADKGVGL